MAKDKAIYAPGELSKVRGKLGDIDNNEAKRMAQVLGGEVGYERPETPERRETVELKVKGRSSSNIPRNRIEVSGTEDESTTGSIFTSAFLGKKSDPADDPSVKLKTPYLERLKMDRYASLPEFDIKSSLQALVSMFSVISEPVDNVNPHFISYRMNEYYKCIEQLVTSTRSLFPRNNMKRNERMKKTSMFVYTILDTIRYWNIEKMTGELAKMQSRPRAVKVSDMSELLREIYKPLYKLEKLDTERHIKGAYKLLYKVLYIENATDSMDKYQELIRTALSSFNRIRHDIHYLLYPLLMKLFSDRWIPYEQFFIQRRNRYLAFLKASGGDQVELPVDSGQQTDGVDLEEIREDVKKDNEENIDDFEAVLEEDPNDPEVIARKEKEAAREAEEKTLEKALKTMEHLFPRAGWDRLGSFPDLYPYFSDTLKMRKGYELIAPTDPLQQVAVLMLILEEFLFAFRYVHFGMIIGSDGNPVRVDDYLNSIINNWQRYVSESFDKEYLPLLSEYCQMLEQSGETRNSIYAKRTINQLNWEKRLYYLPYYKFETVGPPPFQKSDIVSIYSEVRVLRKYLTAVAAGIDLANKQGGAEAMAPCDGIDNPWAMYNFEVRNPISMRLDTLLASKKRTNAALIFFCLAAVVILDHLINDENSWAYADRPGPLFRSVDGEGIKPLFGVETKVDADAIFKATHKHRHQEKEQPNPK